MNNANQTLLKLSKAKNQIFTCLNTCLKYLATIFAALIITLLVYFPPALAINTATNVNLDSIIHFVNITQVFLGLFTVLIRLLIPEVNHHKVPWNLLLLLFSIHTIAGLVISTIHPGLFWIYIIISLRLINSAYFFSSFILVIFYTLVCFTIHPVVKNLYVFSGIMLSIFSLGIANFIFQAKIVKKIETIQQYQKKLQTKFRLWFIHFSSTEKITTKVFGNSEIFGMVFITELLGAFFSFILKNFLFVAANNH